MNCCWCRSGAGLRRAFTPSSTRRWMSSAQWKEELARPVQAYISTSRDPYLNLSIEHDILTRSANDSLVLFLYVNRPSVIIGRNQNPWLEVNLPLLNPTRERPETDQAGLGAVDLVRRRSGGGTVFHDEGNVNWTVICPRDQFTRDKHAEMVVRALRSCGIDRARVNERHDVVLDQGQAAGRPDPEDTHSTPYMAPGGVGPAPLKVSGSAYKITGTRRALHHGTCLLSSPNLRIIPDYLHSRLRPFIKEARGVESVSSPVGNILLGSDEFSTAVRNEFARMYSPGEETALKAIGEDLLKVNTVAAGCEELRSLKHTYEQTPRFVLSNEADELAHTVVDLTIREGKIAHASMYPRGSDHVQTVDFPDSHSPKLHEIGPLGTSGNEGSVSWEDALLPLWQGLASTESKELVNWLRLTLR